MGALPPVQESHPRPPVQEFMSRPAGPGRRTRTPKQDFCPGPVWKVLDRSPIQEVPYGTPVQESWTRPPIQDLRISMLLLPLYMPWNGNCAIF